MRRAFLALPWLVLTACATDGGDTALDAEVPLLCDAVYIPLVTFEMVDDTTGEPYCGPARVGIAEPVRGGWMRECTCVEDVLHERREGAPGNFPCHVNPPVGEAVTVLVEVEGYAPWSQTITLPYECHPRLTLEVRLTPEGPTP